MALGTITRVLDFTVANRRVRIRDIQLTSGANYTTGGESITPAAVGLSKKIDAAFVVSDAVNSTPLTFQVRYDYTNQKLIAYGQNATPGPAVGQPQVTASTDLSGYTVRMAFIGY